jgi:hypothetical protein
LGQGVSIGSFFGRVSIGRFSWIKEWVPAGSFCPVYYTNLMFL